MKIHHIYIVVYFIFLFNLQTIGQSTTINPRGHCSSYLNRYTSKDQCIYSFIVPKRDSDQCPGLAAQMEDLKEQIIEMKQWKDSVDTNIKLLSNTKESNINLGRCEAQARILTFQNNNLTASNNRLREEKARLQIEVNQNSIQVQEFQSQLEQIRTVQDPLQRNYSQLSDQYRAVQQQLLETQARYETLNTHYKEVAATKNCSDVNKHLPSCAVIKQWGYTKSGDAMIDPDGEGGVDPFLVYCDMESDPSTGITVIKHNNITNLAVQGCEEAGCFSQPVNYNGVTLQQITKLMDVSLACEQFIRYNCFDSKLLKDNTAWWVSRRGEKMRYWGGATPGSNKCACGMSGNCVSRNEACNCDADREEWLFDEGTLRDMTTLPVTNLNFGDVNERAGERGNVTLGPLKCKWNINTSVPSCDALIQAGVTRTRFFIINGENGPIRTQCNLPDTIQTSTLNTTGTSQSTNVVIQRNPNEYTFTNCGKRIGNMGPTEVACNNTYLGSNVKVRVVDGRQIWKVPKSGRYIVRAMAPSGYHINSNKAGRGAVMEAKFTLQRNQVLWIIVGQKGNAHAGSGGSFVVRVQNTYTLIPLVAAGAGGSSSGRKSNSIVLDASGTQRAKDSSDVGQNYGAGGNNGNGGRRGGKLSGDNTPGGGAGFNEDGAKSSDNRFEPPPTAAIKINSNAVGNLAPGVGGTYTYAVGRRRELNGGFGGGGSASKHAPGGAGGYSGGGGGPEYGYSGGGGSFVAQEGKSSTFQLNQREEGEVKFIYLGPSEVSEQ